MFKYYVFGFAALAGVPACAMLAATSARGRGLLVSLLVFSTVLGDAASINFLSMELYRGPDRGFEVTLTDLIALGLAGGLFARGQLRKLPFNSLWLIAWWLVCAVGVLYSESPLLGSFTLFKLVRAFAVYWVIRDSLGHGVPLGCLRTGWVGVALLLSGLAVQQKYMLGIYRVYGPFDHSNTIPLYANMILPCLLIWTICDRNLSPTQSAVTLVAGLGLVFSVTATFSRAGTALAVVSMLLTVGVAIRRSRGRRPRLAAGVCLVLLLVGGIKATDSYLQRIRDAPAAASTAREEFNTAAQMMVHDNQFFGIGLNNFSRVLTGTLRYRHHIKAMASEAKSGVCHHIWWLTAAETGWLGFALFVGALLRWMGLGLFHAGGMRSGQQLLIAGWVTGLFSCHASGFYEWVLRITPVMYQFAIVAGAIVATAEVPTALDETA